MFMKMRNINQCSFLIVSIRTRATVFWESHLALNPLPEVGDPAVDSVLSSLGAAVAEADVADEDMLGAALVGQRTSRVALAAVLALHAPGTEHVLVDAGVGGGADLVGHHAHLHLHQDVWVLPGAVGQCPPAWDRIIVFFYFVLLTLPQ